MSDIERAMEMERKAGQGAGRRGAIRPTTRLPIEGMPTPEPRAEQDAPAASRPVAPSRIARAPDPVPALESAIPQASAAVPRSVSVPDRKEARPALVQLPWKTLANDGYLTPDTPKGLLTEQYRQIKRPILRRLEEAVGPDDLSNLVMVTSSVPGEGKTYTAINLATSLAMERDRTVLLVDADVIKASATQRLGLPRQTEGLTDFLEERDRALGAVIRHTDMTDFRFLPAGRPNERSNELLSSDAMARLAGDLSRRYADRLIVFDCPPMLAANEARAVAERVGQVVFVVAEGDTSQGEVDEALDRFQPGPFVGIVMNKASRASLSAYRYGYG